MDSERNMIYSLMSEVRETVESNENEDGTFRFDALRIRIALEFVKFELEKSIEAHKT